MIFLNNFKKSFSFFLFSSLVENGPTGGQESNSSIEQTRNLERQNLTPEQQEISDKIDSLQKKYETLITSEKITKAVADRLLAGLTSDPEIQNDPEAKPTIDMFNRYRTMFENASSEGTEVKLQLAELKSLLSRASNALEYAAGVEFDSSTGEIKEMSLEKEKLKTITNREFLDLPKEERLQYITKDNIDSEYVSNGSVNELEFNFTFDGVFNRELYMDTTAGQVLPKEVSEVKVGGETYTRKNIGGEFFTPNNNRLTIHDGTKIEIGELRTPEQLESISQENDLKVREFLEKNPGSNEALVSSAISRGIEPDFAKLAFSGLIEGKTEKEASILLEDAMTQFDRYRGYNNLSIELNNGKYSDKLVIGLLIKFSSDWKKSAEEYGISKTSIEQAESNGEVSMGINANLIQNSDNLPDGGYLKGDKLLENPEFSSKLTRVASNIGANRDDLIRVMKAESRLDPRIVNPTSRATGLIQFMPNTAIGLGTTIGHLRAMSAVDQLDYVEKFFKQNSRGKSLDTIEKLYQAVFYPLSLTKGPEFVFGSERSSDYARLVASQNGVISRFSRRSDGLIDGYAFSRYANDHVSKFSV